MTRQDDFPERLRRLAEAVRRSEHAHRDVLTSRNNEIIEANRVGLSLGVIAKATQLSRGYVQDILTNHEVRERAEKTNPEGGT